MLSPKTLATIALLVASATSSAHVSIWADPVDGLWNDSTRWNPCAAPGPADDAVLPGPGSYDVRAAAGAVRSLLIATGVGLWTDASDALDIAEDLRLTSGWTTITGALCVGDETEVNGAAMVLNPDSALQTRILNVDQNASVRLVTGIPNNTNGSAALHVRGPVRNAGLIVVHGQGAPAARFLVEGDLNNLGELGSWGVFDDTSPTIEVRGRLFNRDGAGIGWINWPGLDLLTEIHNDGIANLGIGVAGRPGAAHVNRGEWTMIANPDTVQLVGDTFLNADGAFENNGENAHVLAPDTRIRNEAVWSSGVVAQRFIQTHTGILDLQVRPDAVESVITETASIAGHLEVTVHPIADLNVGDRLTLIEADTIEGRFASWSIENLDDSLTAFIEYEPSRVTLSVLPARRLCRGDIDGDLDTDVYDANILLANFGATGLPYYTNGDLDGDGDVDAFDFNVLAVDFGCLQLIPVQPDQP